MLVAETARCAHLTAALLGGGVVHVGLGEILEVLPHAIEGLASALERALTEDDIDAMCAKVMIPSEDILELPNGAAVAALMRAGDG